MLLQFLRDDIGDLLDIALQFRSMSVRKHERVGAHLLMQRIANGFQLGGVGRAAQLCHATNLAQQGIIAGVEFCLYGYIEESLKHFVEHVWRFLSHRVCQQLELPFSVVLQDLVDYTMCYAQTGVHPVQIFIRVVRLHLRCGRHLRAMKFIDKSLDFVFSARALYAVRL